MENNLKKFRLSAGYNSLNKLSEACGKSVSYLSDLENGKCCPTLATAYAISNILDQSVYKIWPDKIEIIEETITTKVRKIKHG